MGAMVAIGGIVDITAGVAHTRGQHAGLAPDQILHAPETTASQNGLFGSRRHFTVLPVSQCCPLNMLVGMLLPGRRVFTQAVGASISSLGPAIVFLLPTGVFHEGNRSKNQVQPAGLLCYSEVVGEDAD
jgi:hypothetical protein